MAPSPSRFLPRLGKIFFWGISGLVTCFLLGAGWLIWKMPEIARNMYAHWAATDLIVTAYQRSGQIPQTWQDMAPWYADSTTGPRHGLSFEEVQKRVVIDFQKLAELKPNASAPPQRSAAVIRPKGILSWTWINAEEEILKGLTSPPLLDKVPQDHSYLFDPPSR
ncbi:MAG TPA: hypothetical protein VGE29_14665 [Prosthecobacter sp.]